jgi:hypothetical protein
MHGLDWAKSHPAYAKDIYFCLSRQKETGKVYHGRTYALRNRINTTALKAIWLDIDV